MKPAVERSDGHALPDQSGESWINRESPKDISTLAPYKDGFTDILEERRHSSDLAFTSRTRVDVPVYKYNTPRTPDDIKAHVMKSDRVKYTVERLSSEKKVPVETLMKEAQSILDEMAHNLDLKAVRSFAFFLIKVMKALFKRIYVNDEGIQMLQKLLQEYPVLVMPTHRSYMDFLLVSYLFYHYDLPLPVIAAAMDFKGMKFFGWLLRQCGAFYIRRSFGSDHLYWAVFTEYVQTQLRNGDSPLEFFVEGTRSRTNKSYVPKTGMLAASLESYFKAELPDTMLVPITISYDRIVEESLYAYELLGIPKPKESTSGLLKARSILNEDYGSVHMHIGEPISIRQFSTGKIDRVLHALEPRYINSLNRDETRLIHDLAFHIVKQHQRHLVVSPWSLMATILMQSRDGISVKQLIKETDWLKRQAQNSGSYVDWPGDASSESVVRHNLSLHQNVVSVSTEDFIEMKLVRPAHLSQPLPRGDIMLNAASNLILASYRNQTTHVFVRPAIIALSINGSTTRETMSMGELFERYSFLENVLSRDFIFQPGQTRQDFEQAVLSLKHSGALAVTDDNEIVLRKSLNKHTMFYSQMFEPFLLAYWVACQHLLSLPLDVHGRALPKRPKEVARNIQQLSIRLLEEGAIRHYEILSMDLIGNGLSMLADLRTLHTDKRNGEMWISPNNVLLSNVARQIGRYIELPSIQISSFTSTTEKSVVVQAKL